MFFFFQAEDGIRDLTVTGVQTCALPIFFFVERRLRIDDPVGAISVHGVNGLWGILALGLLADGTYGDGWNGVNGAVRGPVYGDPRQFVAQAIGRGAHPRGAGPMAFRPDKATPFSVRRRRRGPAA